MVATARRSRRTQEERTAETRKALIEASIFLIHRLGYGGASTELIAERAGVSRGSILHHFGTRANLMADVMTYIYEQESGIYLALEQEQHLEGTQADWVDLSWQIMSRPSGIATLEILLATRSDQELAEKVLPAQAAIEKDTVRLWQSMFGGTEDEILPKLRLVVWAARGLAVGQVLISGPNPTAKSVLLLRRIYEAALESGVLETA